MRLLFFLLFHYRGSAVILSTRETKQFYYLDDASIIQNNNVSQFNNTDICVIESHSDTEVVVDKGIFTFLLSTTVITFASILIFLSLAFYYCYGNYGNVCKKRKTFQFFHGQKGNNNVSVKKRSTITKSIGYCEHCKGPCCRLPIIRQKTLVRRVPGIGSAIVKPSSRSSNTGSWKNSFDKQHDYNLSNQFTFNNY